MTAIEVIGARADGRPTAEVLSWSRDMVGPALRAAVSTLPPPMRRIAGYHLGWWDESGRATDADGGKALRPALALLASAAVGGDPEAAVPVAVAVELAHNFSLLHDDVMDGDDTRRHRATAWRVFGVNAAILAGDALLALAFDVLAASSHPAASTATRTLTATVQDLLHGQSADLAFETRADVDLPECVRMAENKTGALLGSACGLGAEFGDGREGQVEGLREFGERLGLAFQLVDDLLGIWGDPDVTGKPVYSDLHNRKKSLPVVAALNSASAAGARLARLYHRSQPLSGPDLVAAAELIESAGAREWSRRTADDLLATALGRLRSARPVPSAAAELTALARLLTHRDH